MAETSAIAPPNALIFISDLSGGTVPEFIANKGVLSTESMISVGCLPNMDGSTMITLGTAAEIGATEAPIFDGVLMTPTGKLVVSTVEDENVLGVTVPSRETRIRVWTNRAAEPDQIVIGWGG